MDKTRKNFLVVLFLILVILVLISLFKWASYRVLFEPSKKIFWRPKHGEDIYIRPNSKDPEPVEYDSNVIHCKHHIFSPSSVTMFFCHGNNDNMSRRKYVYDLCKSTNMNLFMFDYRGYGKSGSSASMDKILEDGETAYRYLKKKVRTKYIIIWGESLGGSVAIHVASKYHCRCLVLMSTFSCISDMVGVSVPFNYLLGDCSPIKKLDKVKPPVLVVHSTEDDILPYHMSEKLVEASTSSSYVEHIAIKGPHAHPKITAEQMKNIIKFLGVRVKNDKVERIVSQLSKNLLL